MAKPSLQSYGLFLMTYAHVIKESVSMEIGTIGSQGLARLLIPKSPPGLVSIFLYQENHPLPLLAQLCR